MRKKVSKFLFALMLLSFSIGSVKGQNPISLKFNRTGTDVNSVSIMVVNAQGIAVEGAKATVTSSHPFMGTKVNNTNKILCPNVNGNTDPKIKLTFHIEGLPTDFSFNQVGMDIHALNSSGKYQPSGDKIARQYNVEVKAGEANAMQTVGGFYNIDIANGVGENNITHKVWTVNKKEATKTNGKISVELLISKGADNKGCFLGLSELILKTGKDNTPTPDPLPAETKVYTISWKATAPDFVSEEADGTVVTGKYDISKRMFWKFIPTDKENCFYIQNTATQHYMGSCNKEASPNSIIKTSETPIEYYVGKTTQKIEDIAGCFYMSSTDCVNHDQENAFPLALNKDQVTNNVITWQAGPNKIGSYWTLTESEDLYEVRPFVASTAVGKPYLIYAITSTTGKVLAMKADGTLCWEEKANKDEQTWYFVGESNKQGGYLLVNLKNHQTYNINGEQETRWNILSEAKGYVFRPAATKDDANTNLTVEGEHLLQFQSVHSKLARKNQVYELPCGALGQQYVEQLSITGEGVTPLYYPLASLENGNIVQGKAEKPGMWYTLYTQSKAAVAANGKFTVNIQLNALPLEGQQGFLYFDWDRNGEFETVQEIALEQNMSAEVNVPQDAKTGKTRMRFRLTDNGMEKGDDEVTGQIFDCMLQVVDSQAPALTVSANNKSRGQVSANVTDNNATATATPAGNAAFICWREGNNILSLDKEYQFVLNHNTHLVAYFSPNTNADITGIEEHFAEKNQLVQVTANQKIVEVITSAKIKKVLVFTPNGTLAGQSDNAEVRLTHCPTGTYIVKVYTETQDETAKVLLK